MRLWSLHPKYLDTRGLVAAWREGLLAQKVARGETRGYRHHPQMHRFRATADPPGAVADWLIAIYEEAATRGYRFDNQKIGDPAGALIAVSSGQLQYEWTHLLDKLAARDAARFSRLRTVVTPDPHPLFTVVPGPVEPWEVVRGITDH